MFIGNIYLEKKYLKSVASWQKFEVPEIFHCKCPMRKAIHPVIAQAERYCRLTPSV